MRLSCAAGGTGCGLLAAGLPSASVGFTGGRASLPGHRAGRIGERLDLFGRGEAVKVGDDAKQVLACPWKRSRR